MNKKIDKNVESKYDIRLKKNVNIFEMIIYGLMKR